jgi:hypothetical protein
MLQDKKFSIRSIIRDIFDIHDVSEATSPSAHLMNWTESVLGLIIIFIRNAEFLRWISVLWSCALQYSVTQGYLQINKTCCLHLQGKILMEMQGWGSISSRSISNTNRTTKGVYTETPYKEMKLHTDWRRCSVTRRDRFEGCLCHTYSGKQMGVSRTNCQYATCHT